MQADRHVARCTRQIARQCEIVELLKLAGNDIQLAVSMLHALVASLRGVRAASRANHGPAPAGLKICRRLPDLSADGGQSVTVINWSKPSDPGERRQNLGERRSQRDPAHADGSIASRETVRVSFVQHVSGNSTGRHEFKYFFIARFLHGF
jgi:hypothetical protein